MNGILILVSCLSYVGSYFTEKQGIIQKLKYPSYHQDLVLNAPLQSYFVGSCLILLFVLTQKEAKKSSLNLARLKFYLTGVAKSKANFFFGLVVLFCLIAVDLATATPVR